MDPVQSETLQTLSAPFRQALSAGDYSQGLVWIYVAGLVTALTPCVYPLIAITVSLFGARRAESHWRAAGLSTAFVLGIAAFMTPLGLISALSGFAFGSLMAHPATLVILAALCVIMALSLFGAFEFTLPASWQTRLAHVGGQGIRGAFLMGLVSGIIAAPCTGPVLAVLLSWIATTQSLPYGALALFIYSLGLGTLFWLVGTFAMLLPKSGAWLSWIKGILGVVMIAVALLITQPLWQSLLPRNALFSPDTQTLTWQGDLDNARAQSLAERRPLLLDFAADWCAACEEIEKYTLEQTQVAQELQRFVLVRIDLSAGKATPEAWRELQNYDQRGLPFLVIHHSDGREAQRITGFISAPEFLSIVKDIH